MFFWILFDVVKIDFSCDFVPFCFSVTFDSILLGVAEKSFGASSLLATCTCCFAPQTDAIFLIVDVNKEH